MVTKNLGKRNGALNPASSKSYETLYETGKRSCKGLVAPKQGLSLRIVPKRDDFKGFPCLQREGLGVGASVREPKESIERLAGIEPARR